MTRLIRAHLARAGKIIVSDEYCRIKAQIDALQSNQDVRVRAQAVTLTKDAVLWCRRHLQARHPELAAALVTQAWASFYAAQDIETEIYDLPQFESLFEDALSIQRSNSGRNSAPVAATLDG